MATEPTAAERSNKQKELVLRQVNDQYNALFVQVEALGYHLSSLQSIDRCRLGDKTQEVQRSGRHLYTENVKLLLAAIGANVGAIDAMVLLGREDKG